MSAGGHRVGAGRPSSWISSSETRAIRVPEHLADRILGIARKLDRGEVYDIVQNQNTVLGEVERIIVDYESRVKSTRDWTKARTLINDLKLVLHSKTDCLSERSE